MAGWPELSAWRASFGLSAFCFLAGGLFLLLFSDAEIWPLGPQTPWYAITHDVEDLQHKLFALSLLGLGLVEYERLRRRWHTALTAWVFRIAGLARAALLLFHSHAAGMHQPNGMTLMEHIQLQHPWYATVGVGTVITMGLSELRTKRQKVLMNLWPTLLMVLGVSLMFYTE